MSVPEVAALYWKSRNGELLVGGLPISSIGDRYGTPLFAYDRGIIERKISALRIALPPRFSISYSVKANPNPSILRICLERECGLEVASAGEFQIALNAGCSPKKIIFAGPGKTDRELETVIVGNIGEIHAESQLEVDRIERISARHEVCTRVAIRVNPEEEGLGGAMHMGGKSAPFGVDEEQLPHLLERVSEYSHIDFSGIHLFAGTQILDSKLLLSQYTKALEIFRRAATQFDFPLRTLDFGGGLGIRYFPGEQELDLNEYHEGLKQLVAVVGAERCFADVQFMVEPGRFLVAEAGVYVARITDIKISRGKKYCILDGGMNHHLAASGNLGQVIRRNFPMAILNKIDEPASEAVEIVGPLCTPLDTLGRSVQLPCPEVGDLIGVFQAGAYARTASPLGFLSHPTPPEVLVEHGQDLLIRERASLLEHLGDVRNVAVTESVL